VFHKQTYQELHELTHLSKNQLHTIITQMEVPQKVHTPRKVVLMVDATYFGKRKDRGIWGVMVFKDPLTKEVIWFKFLEGRETSTDYLEGKQVVLGLGYTIAAVVGDGFSGIYEVFKEYPIQFCHFHIKQLVERYVGRNTRDYRIKELFEIIDTLSYTTQEQFTHELKHYTYEYESFIQEKRMTRKTHHPHFIHRDLRSLLRSLENNISYLFTYRNYTQYQIPNTTNGLEGFFKHIKKKLRVHDGLRKLLKQKIISVFLLNSSTVKVRSN
jgi:hypothetical protein